LSGIILSLCIPTYNRVNYLRELLPSLIADVRAINRVAVQVELLISNNASTDETETYLRSLSCPGLSVYRNAENIGGDRNFLACLERASGEYVWLFGDDEMIVPGGIARIFKLLSNKQPILVILRDGKHVLDVAEEVIYPDYGICVREEMKGDESFALSHTLITANLFRKDIFDLNEASSKLYTNYAHMYGLMNGLARGGIIVIKTGVFRSREQRAQFDRWPAALCVKQAGYLWRLADAFDVPRLRRISFRLALNLPMEILSRCLHKIFPNRFGRT
jgi:glycosyltransferase involved in cell wall biosynthesis